MTAFEKLPKLSFAGIQIPYSEIEIAGGVRDHVHEYPHVDGGDPELLGRKLYTFKIKAHFHRTIKGYGELYPTKLGELMLALESSKIDKLVIPQLGTVEKAYAFNWTRRITAKVQSGEGVDIEFREQSIIARSVLVQQRAASLTDGRLFDAAKADPNLLQKISAALDAVQNAINSVTAYMDQAEMYGNLLEAKILGLKRVCEELERLEAMQDAESYPVLTALRDLQTTNESLLIDTLGGGEIATYVVPITTTIQNISLALFGRADKSTDLMHLNPIENALEVPAATELRYFRQAA